MLSQERFLYGTNAVTMVVKIKMFILADQERQGFCYLITMTKTHKYHKAYSMVRKLNRKGKR